MGASPDNPLQGGCLCSAVRYEITTEPHLFYHCHGSICRKCQGALYPTYGSFDRSGFRLLQGDDVLSILDSSEGLHRHFCSRCGAHIFGTVDSGPDTISLSVGTLDNGADPGGREDRECHIFWDSRATWFEPRDGVLRTRAYGDPLDGSES